ncbi:MAG: phosphopantetheine-binding protein [Nocardioidaceae bacterium]
MNLTAAEARDLVGRELRRIVPDADLDALTPDADLRRTLELDSLDFLGFVELLSKDSGVRIDEQDYPALATLASCETFLISRTHT